MAIFKVRWDILTQPIRAPDYLAQGAMQAAGFVAIYYKNLFQRARPWQLWPELMPPVAVSGHASFPSGHATQAHTIAAVLQAAAAGVVPSVDDITTRMAQRIARGREVLGLHYPSDSEAGEFLAKEIAATFLGCPTVGRLLAAANAEWQAYTT
jgi:membrane-associated phospholipid phosphatase